MTKIVQTSISILCIIIFSGLCHAGEEPVTNDQWEARAVLDSFLDAQSKGDTQTIKQCLGADLLRKRSGLLDNPDYPGMLRDAYEGAVYTFVNYDTLSDGGIQIDVQMDTADQESKQIRFVLRKIVSSSDSLLRFLIVSQMEISK